MLEDLKGIDKEREEIISLCVERAIYNIKPSGNFPEKNISL